jgi:hypothetical protein
MKSHAVPIVVYCEASTMKQTKLLRNLRESLAAIHDMAGPLLNCTAHVLRIHSPIHALC